MNDILNEYYDMCEKAVEVQQYIAEKNVEDYPLEGGSFFLIDQSDIEDILNYTYPAYQLLEEVAQWGRFYDTDTWTLEQLWLGYIMYIKFNKLWDKEKKEWRDKNEKPI
jgi:hypothetical protein